MEDINYWAQVTVILAFIGGAFSYFILKPLNRAIDQLNLAISDLHQEILEAEERRHALEIQVAKLEQSARSAHHRIDGLEGR